MLVKAVMSAGGFTQQSASMRFMQGSFKVGGPRVWVNTDQKVETEKLQDLDNMQIPPWRREHPLIGDG